MAPSDVVLAIVYSLGGLLVDEGKVDVLIPPITFVGDSLTISSRHNSHSKVEIFT